MFFGANRIMTLWKDSKALVCSKGDSLVISFTSLLLLNVATNYLYPFDPAMIKSN